ncbi:MAG: hypothetical protein PHD40_01350 [Syntrophomonadaceae bacterium]|nr:hypothetical protein [Syntrophomonadaceae bacterium]
MLCKMNEEIRLRKIYDETASVILRHAVNNRLSSEEMAFLLNLLDKVFDCTIPEAFIFVIKEFQDYDSNEELREIIKANILATDLEDDQSIKSSITEIRDLLSAQEVSTQ